MKLQISTREEIMRLANRLQFKMFRNLLGAYMTFGVRKKKPKLDERPNPLRKLDTLNFIHLQEADELEEESGKRKSVRVPPATAGGIDIIHNLTTGDLSIWLRYSKIGRGNFNAPPNAGVDKEIAFARNATSEYNEMIFVGEMFDSEDEANTYVVKSFLNNTVFAELFNSPDTIVKFDRGLVAKAIEEKYGYALVEHSIWHVHNIIEL
jgi:hypothetical protein